MTTAGEREQAREERYYRYRMLGIDDFSALMHGVALGVVGFMVSVVIEVVAFPHGEYDIRMAAIFAVVIGLFASFAYARGQRDCAEAHKLRCHSDDR